MTTKHETLLQDIERRLKSVKSAEVHPAERTHLETQRRIERERDERTAKLGTEIKLEWVDQPKKWEPATCIVTIGAQDRMFVADPHEWVEGTQRLKPRFVAQGYAKMVEEWAIWKWHSDRGSEIDDTDRFIVDCKLPKMVWKTEPVKAKAEKVAANA